MAVSGDGRSVYAAANGSDSIAVFGRSPVDGALRQHRGRAGCAALKPSRGFPESGDALARCHGARSLFGPVAVTIIPDDRNVYAIGEGVVVFDRNRADGAITQKPGPAGCVSETGTRGDCTDGRALDAANKVTISPDGASAYVTFRTGVAIFDRAPDGALTQKPGRAGCISMDGGAGGPFADSIAPGSCAVATGIAGAIAAVVSPDGRNVYVAAAYSDGLVVLDRDTASGALTAKPGSAGCVTRDGTDGLNELSPHPRGARVCALGRGLRGAQSVLVSPDGNNVYVAGLDSDAIAIFERNPRDGTVPQKPSRAGCVSHTGSRGLCANARALSGPFMLAISPDGKNVYAAASTSGAIAVFDRRAGGTLSQKRGRLGCISRTGTRRACRKARVLDGPIAVASSSDGNNVYAAPGFENTISVLERR